MERGSTVYRAQVYRGSERPTVCLDTGTVTGVVCDGADLIRWAGMLVEARGDWYPTRQEAFAAALRRLDECAAEYLVAVAAEKADLARREAAYAAKEQAVIEAEAFLAKQNAAVEAAIEAAVAGGKP